MYVWYNDYFLGTFVAWLVTLLNINASAKGWNNNKKKKVLEEV